MMQNNDLQTTVNTDTLEEIIDNCKIENLKEVKENGNKK